MEKFSNLNDKELEHLIEALTEVVESDDPEELEYRQKLLRFATEEKESRE